VDRKKDMIISGGFNIYPTEVEQALYQHPGVYEACVFGVPDKVWGESVKAVLVLKPGDTTTPADLIEHCRKHLADFKKPRSIELVAELPKNANGKLARKQLRDAHWAHEERKVG
jgi:acyl-CoA synthetase (AMP-forming)/AMP-acid ligase II